MAPRPSCAAPHRAAARRARSRPLEAEIYAALELGLRDYVEKNGFARVVLGLSGGIDSALVACLAADALGAERVNVAIMPSPYSSTATQSDAHALAATLGARAHELAIEAAMDAYAHTLQADFDGLPPDLTEENLQARIRGNLLMALSNKFGWLVLDDRQQVRDVGRLHHPLRRPGRRVRGHQGRPQDARLPSVRVAQLARGRRGCRRRSRAREPRRSPPRSSRAPPPPSCVTISATRIRSRRMSCSTASCTATSSSTTAASG